jgi:hypothetical protein
LESDRLWSRLRSAQASQLNALYASYCQAVLNELDAEQLTAQHAAIKIAGAMFVPRLDDDPLREVITMVAGELEMPMSSSASAEHRRELRRYVDELKDAS